MSHHTLLCIVKLCRNKKKYTFLLGIWQLLRVFTCECIRPSDCSRLCNTPSLSFSWNAWMCASSSPSGPEGAIFQHSVEVPLLRSELFKDLRWAAQPALVSCCHVGWAKSSQWQMCMTSAEKKYHIWRFCRGFSALFHFMLLLLCMPRKTALLNHFFF